MANYAILKTAIQQVVKTNGNNEITGALLQQSLLAMINSLGGYYQFAGIATPSTNPGTPDQNIFYLCGPGVYPNFGGLVFGKWQIGILKYNGAWQQEIIDVSGFVAVAEGGWFIVDEQLNVALKYDANGLDVAKISNHFKSLLEGIGGGGDFFQVAQDGVFFVDENLNIGVYIDANGIHANNILEFQIVNI